MTSVQEVLVFFAAALGLLHVAASSDDFHPGYVSASLAGHQRLRLTVNYTATSVPDITATVLFRGQHRPLRLRKHYADGQGRASSEMSSQSHMFLTFTFTLPKTIFTLTLEVPPTQNITEAIPDVHFEPEGDIVYPESGDVSVDVTVPAGVGREGVSEETLTYTSYVKNDSFFYVSQDWPITVVEQAASGSGAAYRLDFNTSDLRPEGVLVLRADKEYSDQSGLQMVRGVGVEQRKDFYQQNHAPPVTSDTLALVKQWSDPADSSVQQCNLALTPVCSAFCAAIGPDLSEVNLMKYKYRFADYTAPLKGGTVTSSKLGFLTVTSGRVPDVDYRGEARLKCEAKRGADNSSGQVQTVNLRARKAPSIVHDDSKAEFHTDVASLLVVCKATGLPLPNIIISDPDDTENTPLQDRYPDESYFRVIESDDEISARLWLSTWSFYHRSHVRCTADNGFKQPDVISLDISIL